MVLTYDEVRHLPNLRLSPMGIVPQRDRQPRVIIDYTWSGVNPSTIHLAPNSMQFGRALQWILQHIYGADPRHCTMNMMKVDISNGFYRGWLSTADMPALGVVMPPGPNREQLVAFPLVLPMGWVKSPPHFCAVTETVADLANATLGGEGEIKVSHKLDTIANMPVPTYEVPSTAAPMYIGWHPWRKAPLQYINVYVDDFLGLCEGPVAHQNCMRQALLEALDAIIWPVKEHD